MNSLTEENYLKALLTLANESGEVNVNELSRHLGIKMPTVTSMMKKLAQKGLIHYESYKPLRLTDAGRRVAGLVLRKHRLTEMFLVQQMGFGWEEVHEIAEQVEHIQSARFFDQMDQMLGHPKFDPHGSPIPDAEGHMTWVQYQKLSECQPGQTVRLCAVMDSSADYLKFLNSRELQLALKLTILEVEPFDGSMIVRYGKRNNETLSRTVCERLLVEPVKA